MNKVLLIGNLTKDPEIRETRDTTISILNIAVNRKPDKDGEIKADFFRIVTFNSLADNCNRFLVKGNKIACLGSIQNGSYENKDGETVYYTEIIANEIEFLTPKKEDKEEPKKKYAKR